MLFETNNYDNSGIDLTYLNIPLKTNMHSFSNKPLYDVKEGFLKGNMFKDEFDPYKNYAIATIIPKDKKEELELKLYEYDFAINDLNLYLDLHPENIDMFNKFKSFVNEFEKLKKEYVDLIGPLNITDTTSSSYNWVNTWPWENKGGNI